MTRAQRDSVVCSWLSLNTFPSLVSSHPLFSVLDLFLFFFAITCPAPGWVSLAPPPVFVLVVVYLSCARASVQPLSSRLELGAIKISVLSTFHKVFWKSSPQNEVGMCDTAWETQFQDNMCVLSWATCVCLPAGTRWWLIDLHHRYLQNKQGVFGWGFPNTSTLFSLLLLSGCNNKWRTHLLRSVWLHLCRNCG